MPFSSLGWTGDGDFEGYFVVSPKTALESAMYTQKTLRLLFLKT